MQNKWPGRASVFRPPCIRTFVVSVDRCGALGRLQHFDIPTAGLSVRSGDHHEAAIRLARAGAAIGYVAFDERSLAEPTLEAARAHAARLIAEAAEVASACKAPPGGDMQRTAEACDG